MVPHDGSVLDNHAIDSKAAAVPSDAWSLRAVTGFVILGLTIRLVRYLLNFPLWCDESMLAANFLDRGFSDLLEPLDYRQIAPLLFLQIERASVALFGFREWSLRLFPILSGLLSVLLFRHLAGRLFSGSRLVIAVAVFAVSGWPLCYAAEVKPYASDLLVSLSLLALAVEWWRRPDRTAWLWGLVLVAPIALALSFPAILTAGGIGLALLPLVLRSSWRVRIPYLAYGIASAVTFLGLFSMYQTAPQDHDYFHRDWAPAFPPSGGPLHLIFWFLRMSTGFGFAYPEGGGNGASLVTTLCVTVGAFMLGRRGQWTPLALLLSPFLMGLVAAALHRYPYGLSARTMQYVAPHICLLMGGGLALLINRSPLATVRRRGIRFVVVALAMLGFGRMTWDLTHPYKFYSDARSRAFAEWFWTEMSRDAEVACLGTDMGVVADPGHWNNDLTDQYLCYRQMFSPRHRRGEPLRLEAVALDHPLRCVLYNEFPQESPEFQDWLNAMSANYHLTGIRHFPVHTLEHKRGATWDLVYVVYEFVPIVESTDLTAIPTGSIRQ